MSKKIEMVYFDMDGVLVDNMETLAHLDATTVAEIDAERALLKQGDPSYDHVIHLIRKHLYQDRVFVNAWEMPEFQAFYGIIQHLLRKRVHVEILSSATRHHDVYQEICEQKTEWLKIHGLDLLPRNYSRGARDKKLWANPHALLIDDYIKNVEEFKAAGGNAIHHTNINDTIIQLQSFNLL